MRSWLCLLPLLALCAPLSAKAPAHGVIGVQARHLDPEFWISRLPDAQRVRLDRATIENLNASVEHLDETVHDLDALPAKFSRRQVRAWIEPISAPISSPLFFDGKPLAKSALDATRANAALDAIPAWTNARFGLVVHRANLRTFPTTQRVFARADDNDIDRWQESALFPGTPVIVLHESRERDWWFVVSPRYAAWIESKRVALGARHEVLAYGRKSPYLVVTGPSVETVFTPERPDLSQLRLDMGVRVPRLADWPPDRAVDGQHPYAAHVIELPRRRGDGVLQFAPALLPRHADVRADYLPYTSANLIAQGFKFLGERYGWGHSYDARDCSGFVSEVYRSVGIDLPRNSGDQGRSEAFERIAFDAHTTHAQRLAIVETLQPGDLVYLPGHVMMVLGRVDGITYVIHDTPGIGYRGDDGRYRRVPLNQVAVTPLEPLMADESVPTVDTIYSIQRIRPRKEQK